MSENERTVYVGSIPPGTTAGEVRAEMSRAGTVSEVRLQTSFAFVRFRTLEETKEALKKERSFFMQGTRLSLCARVSFSFLARSADNMHETEVSVAFRDQRLRGGEEPSSDLRHRRGHGGACVECFSFVLAILPHQADAAKNTQKSVPLFLMAVPVLAEPSSCVPCLVCSLTRLPFPRGSLPRGAQRSPPRARGTVQWHAVPAPSLIARTC